MHSRVKSTILLVEDDADLRRIMEDLLAMEGFRVASAAHGGEALAWLALHTPELIVTDLQMPKVDGWALLAAIKREPRLANIPVLVSSADLPFDRATFPETVSFTQKTGDPEALLRAVRARITRARTGFPAERRRGARRSRSVPSSRKG